MLVQPRKWSEEHSESVRCEASWERQHVCFFRTVFNTTAAAVWQRGQRVTGEAEREHWVQEAKMLHVCNVFRLNTLDWGRILEARSERRLHRDRPGTVWGRGKGLWVGVNYTRQWYTRKSTCFQYLQYLLVNMEIPSLEQLCDEAQCIILRNQIKLKHPLATLPCAVQHLAEANNEYRLIPSPNGIALSWSSLLWHWLSSGKKITRKIKRQNKPEAVHDRQTGPKITH